MKKPERLTLLLLVQAVVLAVLALSLATFWINGGYDSANDPFAQLDCWASDYAEYEDGWQIDRTDAQEGQVEYLYGPYVTVPAGSYTIAIDYEASGSFRADVRSMCSDNAYLQTHVPVELSPWENHLEIHFETIRRTNAVEVVLVGDTPGRLTVRNIAIRQNSGAHTRNLVGCLLLFLLLDALILWARRMDDKRWVVICIVGLALLTSIPIFAPRLHDGHDLPFHLERIEGLCTELRNGVFPVRMQSRWFNGDGYAVSIYYGDVLLLFPAALRLAGFGVETAYKAYVLLINLMTAIIAYAGFHRLFRKESATLLVSAAYCTSAYRMIDLYARAAVGEYSALAFLPLIASAIVDLYRTDSRDRARLTEDALLLALGMTGVLETHILTTELVVLAIAALCVILLPATLRPGRFGALSLAVGTTVLLNAFFLVPFLDYMLNVFVRINDHMLTSESVPTIQHFGAHIMQYFSFFQFPKDLSVTIMAERMQLTPGAVLMAGGVAGLWCWLCGKANRTMRLCVLFAAAALFVGSDVFPWDALAASSRIGRILAEVQFPWRYLTIAVISLSVLLGELLTGVLETEAFAQWKRPVYVALWMTILVFASLNISQWAYTRLDTVYVDEHQVSDNIVYGCEYMRTLPGDRDDSNNTFELIERWEDAEYAQATVLSERGTNLELWCIGGEEPTAVVVPRVNYKGYVATDDAGKRYEIEDGLGYHVAFWLPAGFEGAVHVRFVSLWYWRAAEAVSLLTALALALWAARRRSDDKMLGRKQRIH